MDNNIWQLDIWKGWKQITDALKAPQKKIEISAQEHGLPIRIAFNQPILVKDQFLGWFRSLPIGFNPMPHQKRIRPIQHRLSHAISSNIRNAILDRKGGKHWETIVGFKLSELMAHLESKFGDGMSWDNYGKWQIDHILPQSHFKFLSYKDEEFKKCWDINNLQPLWKLDNIIKSNKLNWRAKNE